MPNLPFGLELTKKMRCTTMPPKSQTSVAASSNENTYFALPDLTLNEQRLIVPFSLGAKYHNEAKYLASFFQALTTKIEQGRISQITFVIADTLQAYNHLAIEALSTNPPTLPSSDSATKKIREDYLSALDLWLESNSAEIQIKKTEELTKGTDWLAANKTSLDAVEQTLNQRNSTDVISSVSKIRWDNCLSDDPETNSNCATIIRNAYINNLEFAELINQMIETVSSQKITALFNQMTETQTSDTTNSQIITLPITDTHIQHTQMSCAAYIFEELAIIAKWQQANHWDSMLYPFSKSPFNVQIFNALKTLFNPTESTPLLALNAMLTTLKQAEKAEKSTQLKAATRLKKAQELEELAEVIAQRKAKELNASDSISAPILIPYKAEEKVAEKTYSNSPPEEKILEGFAALLSGDNESVKALQTLLSALQNVADVRQRKSQSPPSERSEGVMLAQGSVIRTNTTSLLTQHLSLTSPETSPATVN